jgi:hypothetical protein
MAFIKKIKELSFINEITSKQEIGDISPIINNLAEIKKLLNVEKRKFVFNSKEIDLDKISEGDFTNLLKNIEFKKALRSHFKKNSYFRNIILGSQNDEHGKRLFLKEFLKEKSLITRLFKKLNNGVFKRTIIYDISGRINKNIMNLTKDNEKVKKITKILIENGYKDVIFEIGSCYEGKTLTSINDAFEKIISSKDSEKDKDLIKEIKDFIGELDTVYDDNYKIIFTLETRKVASQSTRVNWRSCMNLENGVRREMVGSGISSGLAAVYITKVGDELKIDYPLARILIKPMIYEAKTGSNFNMKNITDEDIYYYLDKTYTSTNSIRTNINVSILDKFEKKVNEIIENVNKQKVEKLAERENKTKLIYNLQRKGEDRKQERYYADTVNKVEKDLTAQILLEKLKNKKEVNKEEVFEYFKKNHNDEIIKLLMINNKDDIIKELLDKKYILPPEVDVYELGRIPDIDINKLTLNARDNKIKATNKSKQLNVNELIYKPVEDGKNNLEEIDKDTTVSVDNFTYLFNKKEGGKFKITNNLKYKGEEIKQTLEIGNKKIDINKYEQRGEVKIHSIESQASNEKLKRIKVTFSDFDKNFKYTLTDADISFTRKTNDENKSFFLVMNKNSIINSFPENYYLTLNFYHFEQIKYFYKNIFNILIKAQNEYIDNIYKKTNKSIEMSKTIMALDTLLLVENENRDFVKETLGINIFDKQIMATLLKKTKDIVPLNLFIIAGESFLKNSSMGSENYIEQFEKIEDICKAYKININYVNDINEKPSHCQNINEFISDTFFNHNIKKDNFDLKKMSYIVLNDTGYISTAYILNQTFFKLDNINNVSKIKIIKLDKIMFLEANVNELIIDKKTIIKNDNVLIKGNGSIKNLIITDKKINKYEILTPIMEIKVNNCEGDTLDFSPSKVENISFKNVKINNLLVDKKDYNLYIDNCNQLPEKIECKRLEIENSNIKLPEKTIIENLYVKNSDVTNYSNIDVKTCFSRFKKGLTISNEKIDDNLNDIPIILKTSDYDKKIKSLFKETDNLFFLDKSVTDSYSVHGNLRDKILNIIISRLNLTDFSRENKELILKTVESLPEHMISYLTNDKRIEKFKDLFYNLRTNARQKMNQKVEKIKKEKPIGNFIKKIKEKIIGDSFVSSINNLESKNYFD